MYKRASLNEKFGGAAVSIANRSMRNKVAGAFSPLKTTFIQNPDDLLGGAAKVVAPGPFKGFAGSGHAIADGNFDNILSHVLDQKALQKAYGNADDAADMFKAVQNTTSPAGLASFADAQKAADRFAMMEQLMSPGVLGGSAAAGLGAYGLSKSPGGRRALGALGAAGLGVGSGKALARYVDDLTPVSGELSRTPIAGSLSGIPATLTGEFQGPGYGEIAKYLANLGG